MAGDGAEGGAMRDTEAPLQQEGPSPRVSILKSKRCLGRCRMTWGRQVTFQRMSRRGAGPRGTSAPAEGAGPLCHPSFWRLRGSALWSEADVPSRPHGTHGAF